MVIFIIVTYVSRTWNRLETLLKPMTIEIFKKLREYPISIILPSRNGIFFLSEKADIPDGR